MITMSEHKTWLEDQVAIAIAGMRRTDTSFEKYADDFMKYSNALSVLLDHEHQSILSQIQANELNQ